MPKLTDAQKHQLREAIEKHQLTAIATLLEEMAQSAVYMVTTEPDTYTQVGNIRIGGVPDLPSTFEWPKTERGYMVFVAQINLAELPHLEDNPLPSKGMLYFFISSIFNNPQNFSHQMLFWNGHTDHLRKTKQPIPEQFDEDPEWAIYDPCQVQITAGISTPCYGSPRWKVLDQHMPGFQEDGGKWMDRYFAFQKELCGVKEKYTSQISQIWGYQTVYDLDTVFEAQLWREGRWQFGTPIDYSNLPDVEATQKWHLLLELGSHRAANMLWMDAGKLQFYIHEDELKQLDFSKTYATLVTS